MGKARGVGVVSPRVGRVPRQGAPSHTSWIAKVVRARQHARTHVLCNSSCSSGGQYGAALSTSSCVSGTALDSLSGVHTPQHRLRPTASCVDGAPRRSHESSGRLQPVASSLRGLVNRVKSRPHQGHVRSSGCASLCTAARLVSAVCNSACLVSLSVSAIASMAWSRYACTVSRCTIPDTTPSGMYTVNGSLGSINADRCLAHQGFLTSEGFLS